MALQMNVATRNARLDVIESTNGTSCSLEVLTGAVPASCATADAGSVLATINLPADWMTAAGTPGAGQKGMLGTWSVGAASGSGNAGHFRIYNSQATKNNTTCFLQGTVTATGGGGDMTVDNVVFAANQTFTVTSFTLTEGNA